jgi:hypothetical protein
MSTDLLNSIDRGGFSTDPSRPDYACPAYLEMAPRWSIVEDALAGTPEIRAKKAKYLPKFEAETPADWDARVAMTFVNDHYSTTLAEHVGLVTAVPIKLEKDVPPAIRDLIEDIDGEGNHLDVFAQAALEAAMHLGHAVIFTDFPVTDNIKSPHDAKKAKVRPYAQLYRADEVISWRSETIGGVQVLVQIVFRETTGEGKGEFGVAACTRYREISQEVFYDALTGRAIELGAITWRVWKVSADAKEASGAAALEAVGAGTITGVDRIAARVIYGGQKIALLHTKPHLYGLALLNIEETQVASDYACVMHKCNVPTPVFIGRNVGDPTAGAQKIQMGHGIDIPIGGDAKFLEPAGTAIAATRARLQDIQAQMRRQGATMDDATASTKTAAEARLYAKQRNAKITRAARSTQDAIEGMFADIAAFLGISTGDTVKSGGSVVVNQDFAGEGLDPAYLTVLVSAYQSNALPLDALLYALEKGRLPEDFQEQEGALRLIANELANKEIQRLELEHQPEPAGGRMKRPMIPASKNERQQRFTRVIRHGLGEDRDAQAAGDQRAPGRVRSDRVSRRLDARRRRDALVRRPRRASARCAVSALGHLRAVPRAAAKKPLK